MAIVHDRGAVIIGVISPTRIVLVMEERVRPNRKPQQWKLPGGSIEESDEDVVAAAIRECREETGVELGREEVTFVAPAERTSSGYKPNLCLACVSEEKLDTHIEVGDEDGDPLKVAIFDLSAVVALPNFLKQHLVHMHEVLKRIRAKRTG